MSESGDYDPGPWQGHDFKEARKHYDAHAGRSYSEAKTKNVAASDLVPDEIVTASLNPMFVRVDVTGSMSGWPNTIFSKLPYLDHEVRTEYLGEDAEISFGAISDTGDSYPLQVQPFSRRTDMKECLAKLVVTNGGAGPVHYCEAYALAALYDLHNVRLPPKARKPPYIIIGDEMPYDMVTRSEAERFAKAKMEESRRTAEAIFKELMRRYSVYLVLKPYYSETLSGDRLDGQTGIVYERWAGLIGAERIALLPEADRVVDVIFGLLAKEVDKVEYFREEIEGRQRPDQVATVYKSLETVHRGVAAGTQPGRSTMHRPSKGKKSNDLL